MAFFAFEALYYLWKYEDKDWQRKSGVGNMRLKFFVEKELEIEAENPGIMNLGLPDPDKYRYYHPSFEKRVGMLDVGETQRPW